MFKKIGSPTSIETVSFKKSVSENICCSHCKCVVGKRNGNFFKFSGSNTVVISVGKFICPTCGKFTETK